MFSFFRRKSRREIYPYWDGQKQRFVDPVVAWRAMWEDPDCNPEADFGPATGIDSQGRPAEFDPASQDKVLAMIRRMFGVKSWSENVAGLTVNETFELLWDFLRYMDSLKKKRDRSLTPSPPTDSTSSEESTTPPESDLSSTNPELRSDEQPSSSKRSVRL